MDISIHWMYCLILLLLLIDITNITRWAYTFPVLPQDNYKPTHIFTRLEKIGWRVCSSTPIGYSTTWVPYGNDCKSTCVFACHRPVPWMVFKMYLIICINGTYLHIQVINCELNQGYGVPLVKKQLSVLVQKLTQKLCETFFSRAFTP